MVLLFSRSVGAFWGYLPSRSVSLFALWGEIRQLFKYFQEYEFIAFFISMQPTKGMVTKEIRFSVIIARHLIPIPSPQVTKMLSSRTMDRYHLFIFHTRLNIYAHEHTNSSLLCCSVAWFLLLLGCVWYKFPHLYCPLLLYCIPQFKNDTLYSTMRKYQLKPNWWWPYLSPCLRYFVPMYIVWEILCNLFWHSNCPHSCSVELVLLLCLVWALPSKAAWCSWKIVDFHCTRLGTSFLQGLWFLLAERNVKWNICP